MYSFGDRNYLGMITGISTPEEAESGYQLAVCSNNLVLVGRHVARIKS